MRGPGRTAALGLLLAGLASVHAQSKALCDGTIHPFLSEMSDGLAEGCFYQKLVERYVNRTMKQLKYKADSPEAKAAQSEVKKSLTRVMPNGNSKENRINVWYLDVTDIYSYSPSTVNMRGYMLMSWDDDRLSWRYESDMSKDKMKIHYSTSIWIPDVNWRLSSLSLADNQDRDTWLHRNGTVFHQHGFYGRSPCELDLSDYPNDVQHCCLDFASQRYAKYLKLELKDGAKVILNKKISQTYWKVKGDGVMKMTKDDNGNDMVHACFDLQRPSATLPYFIILPLASTAVLAILIPLFTDWKFQITAKFMALLLQFLSLGLTMTDDVKNSLTVPKYLLLYELLIWTTVASLSVTVIFWALSKKRQILPPPAPLLDLVNKVNPLFCGNVAAETKEGQITENGLSKQDHVKLGDWEKVFVGLNNLSLVLFTAVYLLGIIILCA